ncbi:MAG: hypothetical protein A3E31_03790 [Candidatus Rokubacteria bacterium RIFCSPHIGHO2_12_FULL_73_22]|nr:MAG: hypothetical protein A3E31_03790 [Candidatus Rokubacteria bacterium RIFCSPHIGHO2_12_FULL_73_22]OGL09672.1 MAG: hypothetical protein A3I14_09540 [Candidatus Rokubacteria bacterium RIFCSPLOWO2_02_FULL_73_56]OGL24521.1 MAG: hypothetical protein A3G44_03520 [Candidatus Rokubacteria bacterium RIFCSPLOWO2_12_FULL_73_47]
MRTLLERVRRSARRSPRRTSRWLGAALAGLVLAPRAALACATCIASGYGDRTFNWAYAVLMGLPFALLLVVGGVLAWCAGVRPRAIARAVGGRFRPNDPPDTLKETI